MATVYLADDLALDVVAAFEVSSVGRAVRKRLDALARLETADTLSDEDRKSIVAIVGPPLAAFTTKKNLTTLTIRPPRYPCRL